MNDNAVIEVLCEQAADIRALLVVNCFLTQTLLESVGVQPEPLMNAIEQLNLDLGDQIENSLRSRLGLQKRDQTRAERLQRFRDQFDPAKFDWSNKPVN
ncbi:MAG: hypothetical protein KF831_10760 [Acidobacteria bacterium]|nr:hypothetical protein [Acidobacteriota bacterium]